MSVTGGAHKAMGALVAVLGAAAEEYQAGMAGRPSLDEPLFSERVREWAYLVADELAMASIELECHGLGR